MNKQYCPKCGAPSIVPKANFCASCGTAFGNVVSLKVNAEIPEIETDEDGYINLALAKKTKQIDFEVVIPFEKQDGTSLKELMSQSEK